MKKFLIGVLTMLLTLTFIFLGIIFNIESMVVDTVDVYIKEEITKEISTYVANNTDAKAEDISKEITQVMENNDTIKRVLNEGIDKAIEIFSGKEVTDFSFTNELESLIEESEGVLKEHGILLTQEDKNELMNIVSSEEFSQFFNESVKEVQENIPANAQKAVDALIFFRSMTFKMILIGIVILLVLFIALLKKSSYKWLSNLGGSALISGIVFGILFPFFIDLVNKELSKSSQSAVVVSGNSIKIFGYYLIGIGICAIVLDFVLSKINKKNSEKVEESDLNI